MPNAIMRKFMDSTANNKLREMIKRHEGIRLSPYFCSKNHQTIGYGWNMDAHKLPDDIAACLRVTGSITENMADRLLNISITVAMDDCRSVYRGFDSFSEVRQAALSDFMFNVGSKVAMKFKKMRAAIEAGDWSKAADEMTSSAWFSQVGDRSSEIVGMVRTG